MGGGAERGVVPRICQYLFERAADVAAQATRRAEGGNDGLVDGADGLRSDSVCGEGAGSTVAEGRKVDGRQEHVIRTTWSFRWNAG